ncbi:hypothetical protein L1887_00476 [Cichorium endivia]|nr:hypothetical protein L1887_00476 [Cichorium endivia]
MVFLGVNQKRNSGLDHCILQEGLGLPLPSISNPQCRGCRGLDYWASPICALRLDMPKLVPAEAKLCRPSAGNSSCFHFRREPFVGSIGGLSLCLLHFLLLGLQLYFPNAGYLNHPIKSFAPSGDNKLSYLSLEHVHESKHLHIFCGHVLRTEECLLKEFVSTLGA